MKANGWDKVLMIVHIKLNSETNFQNSNQSSLKRTLNRQCIKVIAKEIQTNNIFK